MNGVIIKKKNGFSLVEILVSFSILGVLFVGVVNLSTIQTKVFKKITKKQEIEQTIREIAALLAREDICSRVLQSVNVNNSPELSIRNRNGEILYNNSSNKNIGNGVFITSIKANKDPDNLIDDNSWGHFELTTKFNYRNSKRGDFVRKVKVTGQLSGGIVQNCVSYELEALKNLRKKVCHSIGGTINSNGKCVGPGGGNEGDLIKETACKVLGGNLTSNKCDALSLNGSIEADSLNLIEGRVTGTGVDDTKAGSMVLTEGLTLGAGSGNLTYSAGKLFLNGNPIGVFSLPPASSCVNFDPLWWPGPGSGNHWGGCSKDESPSQVMYPDYYMKEQWQEDWPSRTICCPME